MFFTLLLTAQASAAGVSFDVAAQAALKGMQPSPTRPSQGMKGFVFAERTPSPGVLTGYLQGNRVNRVVIEGRVPFNTVMPPYVFDVAATFTGKWCGWKDDDSIYTSMIRSYFNAVRAPLELRSFRAGTCTVDVTALGQARDAHFAITQVGGPPKAPPVQAARSQPAPSKSATPSPAAPPAGAAKVEALNLLGTFTFNSPMTAFTLSDDDRHLVTGHQNGQVVVWDFATRKVAQVYPAGGRGAIQALAVSPSGSLLAVQDTSGQVTVLRSSGTSLARFPASGKRPGVAFSPDGTLLAFAGEDGLSLSSVLNETDVFAPYKTYAAFSGPLAFTADSRGLFGMSREVMKINLADGWSARVTGEDYEFLDVESLSFSRDRSRLLIHFRDSHSVSVVNTGDMRLVREFSDGPAVLSGDGRQLLCVVPASAGGGIEVVDVDSGKVLEQVRTPNSGPPVGLGLTLDGRTLLTFQNGMVRVWGWTNRP